MANGETPPALVIDRYIGADGLGTVDYTLRPDILSEFIGAFGADTAEETAERVMRRLCKAAGTAAIRDSVGRIEDKFPGNTSICLVEEAGQMQIRSSDVGREMMMRMLPEWSDDDELKFDPQY